MSLPGTYGIEDAYQGVIDDVIAQLKDAFLDECVDADVLQQLKKSWEVKLGESGAINSEVGKRINGTGARKKTTQRLTFVGAGQLMRWAAQSSSNIVQLDGGKGKTAPGMTDESSEEEEGREEEEEDPTMVAAKYGLGERNDDEAVEEEPLNSGDDQSDDEDLDTLFDAENVVVCQFEKVGAKEGRKERSTKNDPPLRQGKAPNRTVHRARNKWRFTLKDGVMHIRGKDYCFQKCTGEAEW